MDHDGGTISLIQGDKWSLLMKVSLPCHPEGELKVELLLFQIKKDVN